MWHDELVKLLRSDAPGDIERASQLKEANFPPRLYKYRGPTDAAVQNLKDGTVWLSSAARFNDPYDSALSVDLDCQWNEMCRQNLREEPPTELEPAELARVLEAINPLGEFLIALSRKKLLTREDFDRLRRRQTDNAARLTEEFSANLSGIHQDALKACSFSANPASLVMWAHYADCHRGFCIEYATSALDSSRRQRLFPVVYTPARFSLTEEFMRFTANGNRADPLSPAAQHLPALAAMHKSDEWAYEREWRLLCLELDKPAGLAVAMPQTLGRDPRQSCASVV